MMNVLMSKMTRRRLLTLGLGTTAAGACGLGAAIAEARWLQTTFRRIEGIGLPKKLRVLHLSDFHASDVVPWSLIRESIEKGLAEKPDLVFITGDHVSGPDDNLSGYPDALAPLRGHPHCFACFGNHDGKYRLAGEPSTARRVGEIFAEAGIRSLVNEAVDLDFSGGKVRVAGLGDLWRKQVRPDHCLPRASADAPPTLLLAHNPDTKELVADYHWDVMFSGHTHGGQVVVPFLNWAPVLPVEDRSMVAGLYRWRDRWVHITRGVGNLHGIRFACRPEVSILDLV